MTRPTILDLDLVVVPIDTGDTFSNSSLPSGMVEAGSDILEKCDDDLMNDTGPDWDYGMQAVATFRAMLSASPYPTAWDDVRKYVEGLEERLRSETFRADVNDKILTKHFEASQAKSVEIQNLKAYIDKTAKDVAETITEIRKRDVSVEQRMRAEAAEARISELEAERDAAIGSAERQWAGWVKSEAESKQRIAELEKRLADAERVIGRIVTRACRVDLHGDGALWDIVQPSDTDAARAYMEGK